MLLRTRDFAVGLSREQTWLRRSREWTHAAWEAVRRRTLDAMSR